jgi:hypothetical protein
LEDFHSPQTNAINLLIDLARDRKKHTFMGILTFINGVLNKYLETPSEQRNGREKDGALCMIGCLADQILRKKSPVAGMMEPFFVTHIIPEFKSPFPFLRARACDITKHFSDLDFSNEQVRLCHNFCLVFSDCELTSYGAEPCYCLPKRCGVYS